MPRDIAFTNALEEHRRYLADPVRLQAYRTALAETVSSDDVVLDLGSGTAVLGVLACGAGAKHVYAVDRGSIVQVGREIAQANGVAERITFIRAHSSRIELPEQVNVIVADQMSPFGLGAGLLPSFAQAAQRWLAPAGRCIPSSLTLWLAPATHRPLADSTATWSSRPEGIDVSRAGQLAAHAAAVVELPPEALLAEPSQIAVFALPVPAAAQVSTESHFVCSRAGTLHGLLGTFSAQLSPRAAITNTPGSAQRIDREQFLFPLAEHAEVAVGAELRVKTRLDLDAALFSWNAAVRRDGDWHRLGEHSTFHGMPLASEDLKRSRPDHVPALTAWGRAQRTVLQLCDGTHTVARIEQALSERHGDLFADGREVAAFVAAVLEEHS